MLAINKINAHLEFHIGFLSWGGGEIFYTMFKDNPPKKLKLNDALDMKASYLRTCFKIWGGGIN